MTIREMLQKIEDLKKANLASDDSQVWLDYDATKKGEAQKVFRHAPGFVTITN